MSNISDFKSAPFDLFQTTSAATSPVMNDTAISTLVGSKWKSADGREYALVQCAGTAIASGVVVQSPAVVSANFVGLSPATSSTTSYSAAYKIAAAIGDKQIQIATGATAALANRFAGGYLNTVEGTGLGQTLKIASNLAASTTSALVVNLEDPFTTATSTDTRYTLTLNPYGSKNGTDVTTDGVIISPVTTLTGTIVGVCPCPIPASTATVPSYGYVQTKGPIAVLAGTPAVAIGIDVCAPSTVAGGILTYTVAGGPRLGTTMVASANTKYNMVNLSI